MNEKFALFLEALEKTLQSDEGKDAINAVLKASHALRVTLHERLPDAPAPLLQIADKPATPAS